MKITDHGQGATEEQLRVLEAQVARELPRDYVAFMRQYNGGVPVPNVFDISGSRFFSEDEVEYLLSLDAKENYMNIIAVMDAMADRLPDGHVPIAEASCGAMLILCCNSVRFGSVWYWDPQDLADDGGPALWPVAGSFASLLDALRDDPTSGATE